MSFAVSVFSFFDDTILYLYRNLDTINKGQPKFFTQLHCILLFWMSFTILLISLIDSSFVEVMFL